MISQPTVPIVEPIRNDPNARMVPQSRDADLDTYCKAVSPLSPDSEHILTDALGLVSGSSSQHELSSIEPGPEVQTGNPELPNWTAEGMDAAQLSVTMKSEHPNRVTSTKLRPLASSSAVADCPTEVALMAHAKSEVGLNTAGSSPQPQLDEAVRLTREAVSAWMHVLAGPATLRVTTR